MDNGESHASEHIDGKAARQTNATVHTRRPSWYRIVLACLALAAILLTCSQLVGTQSDMAGYAYCVGLQLLLMLLVPIWPVPCSVALICCNGVFMAVGVFTGAWQWGGLLAIATLGISCSWPVAALACLAQMLSLWVLDPPSSQYPGEWTVFLVNEAMVLCCALFGIIVRRHRLAVAAAAFESEQTQRHEREMREQERRYHDILLASRLHDTVSGSLSLAIRQAQRQLRVIPPGEEHDAWQQVYDVLREGTTNVGRLIDQLHVISADAVDGGDDTVGNPERALASQTVDGDDDMSRDGIADRISQVMAARDRTCAQLRLAGSGTYRETPGVRWSKESYRQTMDLLGELYTNLIKHGRPDATTYEIVVRCEPDRVEVSELCRLRQQPAVSSSVNTGETTTTGGHGIALLAERIRLRGGVLHIQSRPDMWACHAVIPHDAADIAGPDKHYTKTEVS